MESTIAGPVFATNAEKKGCNTYFVIHNLIFNSVSLRHVTKNSKSDPDVHAPPFILTDLLQPENPPAVHLCTGLLLSVSPV